VDRTVNVSKHGRHPLTARHKEDRVAIALGQRQQFAVAAFPPYKTVKPRCKGPRLGSSFMPGTFGQCQRLLTPALVARSHGGITLGLGAV
jgi:hypothetical protein